MNDGAPASAPLAGVRVIDLTRLLPGAFCTLVLADLGADIIKIEDPNGGDLVRTLPPHVGGLSVYHHALNRNKRSVTLDLRARGALDVLDRLVENADVLIESFRPRTARRLKVSAGDLRARHARLVHCSLTGFGQSGPYVDRAAHDLDFVALSGLFEIDQPEAFAGAGAPPSPAGLRVPRVQIADVGGAWAAATAILAALFARERTGQGSALDIALNDVALSWLTFSAAGATMRPGRTPGRLPITGDAACYNVYTTADARHLALGAVEQKFWETFCRRVGRPDLVPLQFVPDQQRPLREQVAAIFRERTAGDWVAMFADTDICLAPVNSIGEALDDPQAMHRGAVTRDGIARFIRAPIVFQQGPASGGPADRVPIVSARPLGADTDEVLQSAGFSGDELRELRARHVV